MSEPMELTAAALAAAGRGAAAASGGPAAGPPFVARLPDSAVLALAGSDARGFLHGQLANDVNGLGVGQVGRSLLLNHKGHAMAEAAVVRADSALYCVIDDRRLPWVKDTLQRHIVFDDVQLSEPASAVLTVQGERAGAVLEAAGLPVPVGDALAAFEADPPDARVFVYPSRRSLAGGFDLVMFGAGGADELLARLEAAGAVVVGPEQLAAARIAALLPSAGAEGGEGVLPQESGLTSLLSYRKGCYLGQEIMARIEARGKLRRSLASIELDGLPDEPAGPADDARAITAEGRTVGVLGSVARFPDGSTRALAVLRNDLSDGARLSVGGVAGRRLTPAAPIMPA